MALTVKQLVNRHGAFVSAVTGLAVGIAIVVLALAQHLVGVVSAQGFAFPVADVLLTAVPFAVGYFLSLWIIAPIADELRLPHVITRSVLATGVASTVVFIVTAVAGILDAVGRFGLPFVSVAGELGGALAGALLTLISSLPLGILAGILLWLWRKDHPPRRPLSGLIDEV